MRFYNKKDKTDVYKKPALIHEVSIHDLFVENFGIIFSSYQSSLDMSDVEYRISPAIRRGFPLSRMTINN